MKIKKSKNIVKTKVKFCRRIGSTTSDQCIKLVSTVEIVAAFEAASNNQKIDLTPETVDAGDEISSGAKFTFQNKAGE